MPQFPHRAQIMPFTTPPPAQQVEAGFPSPTTDHTEDKLDLVRLVVRHPAATFFMRVTGSSMTGAGIGDGDLLVVDRSLTPHMDDIVVAVIDGGFTGKRLQKTVKGWVLASEGDGPNIKIDPDQGVEVWGVVAFFINRQMAQNNPVIGGKSAQYMGGFAIVESVKAAAQSLSIDGHRHRRGHVLHRRAGKSSGMSVMLALFDRAEDFDNTEAAGRPAFDAAAAAAEGGILSVHLRD
jgi:DNA polymerase V